MFLYNRQILTGQGMKGELISVAELNDRTRVFEDRSEAGRRLAGMLSEQKVSGAVLLAIPSGGVPVASEIEKALHLPLDLLLVRKIQIPWNTEAGFGAMDPDGEVVFNETLLADLRLRRDQIERQVEETKRVLEHRDRLFRQGRGQLPCRERSVIVVDDGLASGCTMRSAVRFVKKRCPDRLIVAVPTGLLRTVQTLLAEVDEVVCPNVRSALPYAVADAYRHWHDVTDEEVLSLIH